MATQPVKAKWDSKPASESTIAQQEPPENTNTTSTPSHPFINSVTELRSLSTTLSTFLRRYDDLKGHLDYIRINLDPKLPIDLPPPNSKKENLDPKLPIDLPPPNSKEENLEKPPLLSELEKLCEGRCGRNLRIYFLSHISEIGRLREEAPKALKRSRDPARLVLNCLGRFYFQGIKAYTKDSPSPMITSREASIFGLECFLLMGCDGGAEEVKKEAELAALAWRNRLMTEGGLSKACEADARGLLLLICCFGIPSAFSNADIRDLLRSCNLREIGCALRRSSVLKARITEVLEGMVKNKLEVDAVDIAYTLEVENFPLKALIAFLHESEETWKSAKKEAKGSSAAMNRANKKQLANLKSVIKCLEKHKLDPSRLISEWKINEKISSLEKEIPNLGKKKEEEWKRTVDETKSSNKDAKRPRVTNSVQQRPKRPRVADYVQQQPKVSVMEVGFPGLINGYSASPALSLGSGAGSLLVNIAGNGGGLLAAGVGAGLSVGHGGVPPTATYGGVHGGMVGDTATQMLKDYGQLKDRLVGHTFHGHPSSVGSNATYRSSPLLEGFAGLPSHPTLMEGFAGLPSHRPLMEGFVGLPSNQSMGVSSRSSESNLYHFADVVESEMNKGSNSRTGGTVHKSSVPPSGVPSHHSSSCLY